MTRSWRLSLVLLGVLVGAGCRQSSQNGPPSAIARPPSRPMLHLDHAQPKLPTLKLWLGDQEIVAEVARTQTQVATGMMFRQSLGENEGMLFVFAYPHRTSFYMKNTTVPLTAAYLDAEGTILELHDLQPLNESSAEARSDQVQYVLEMNQGWFKRHGIAPGAMIRTEYGKLADAFTRNR